jgi:hypothetical protein
MTQDELLRQLDKLRSSSRLIFLIGIPLALLLETPNTNHCLRFERAVCGAVLPKDSDFALGRLRGLLRHRGSPLSSRTA